MCLNPEAYINKGQNLSDCADITMIKLLGRKLQYIRTNNKRGGKTYAQKYIKTFTNNIKLLRKFEL